MATLDTKYINVGSSGSFYGFTNASIFFTFGDIADSQDGTTNADLDGVYTGADVITLYNIVNTSNSTNTLSLTLTGNRANSGWDTMSIGGSSNSVNRSDATYSYDSTGNTTNWIWSSTYVSSNFFGTTNNADKEVIWATSSGGGGGGGGSTPTYSLTAPTSINEGSAGTVNVSTTNVSNSTTLYWAVQPSGQFGTNTGSVSISGNAASFTLTPTADSSTEGAETATVVLYTDSSRTNNVASDTFTINDTSTGGSGGSTGGGTGGSSNYGIEINSVASSPAAVFGVNFRTSNIQKFSNSTISAGGSVSFTNIGSDATDSAKVVVVVDAGWHTSAGTFPVTRSTANGGTVTVSNNRNTSQTVKIIIVRIA